VQSNNVIRFPTPKPRLVIENDDEHIEAKTEFVDDIIDKYAGFLIKNFVKQGIDITSDRFDTHFGFTMESMRSTLLMTMDIEHPLQEVVDKTVRIMEDLAANDDDEFDPA
jgi:hypothetical protein